MEKHFWPSDDPNQHDPNDNPESDDFRNLSEYLFGYNPTQDTNEPMLVPYAFLSPSQFDPTKGQNSIIEYWVNKDTNEVEISFADASYQNVVRTLAETAYEGLNSATWNGTDANNLVVEPNFFDVNIVAESKYDSADTDTWISPAGSTTSPNASNALADPNSLDNFNPYANLQIRIDFDLSDWGTTEVGIIEPNQAIICRLIESDRLLSPGYHILYWNGRDEEGEIYEGDFTVYQDQNGAYGVTTGVVVVYYDYPTFEIKDLLCNSYRIIPLYNEVSTISYELTRDSDITIDITDQPACEILH